MAYHPAVPVSQYLPDERAHNFVQEQDEGPSLSVYRGRSSDSDPDIELDSLNSTGQSVRQSRNSSPRTAYRQVEQRLGAMKTERLAHRTNVRYAAMPTRHKQTVHNINHASAPNAHHLTRQEQYQDRYLEQVQCEKVDHRMVLMRHDNGQTYQATNLPGGYSQYLEDGGSVVYQYNSSEDLWQNTEGDAWDDPEHI